MQVHHEQSQEETILALQRQLDELTTNNLLLQDLLARKEQFIAIIAHELRGPLSPIISYAQMLTRHTCTPHEETSSPQRSNEVIQRQTSIIISQARRIARLVDDLLDASRLSSGQFTLLRANCDIVALAKEMVEQLRPLAPYHTLVVDAPDTPIMGHWDVGRLQQALGNLLDNATRYSDEHTTITVRIWTTPGTAHVSVHNQGVGIPSADIGLIFHPYTRLPSTSSEQQARSSRQSPRQPSTGLGLYITKSIIEAHQGALRLEPYTEDRKGTTFSFDLPLT